MSHEGGGWALLFGEDKLLILASVTGPHEIVPRAIFA